MNECFQKTLKTNNKHTSGLELRYLPTMYNRKVNISDVILII